MVNYSPISDVMFDKRHLWGLANLQIKMACFIAYKNINIDTQNKIHPFVCFMTSLIRENVDYTKGSYLYCTQRKQF